MINLISKWFSMGGYSGYVWSAYGFAGFILITNIMNVHYQKLKTRKILEQWFKRI